ncbi:YbbR-like domain-containing protein [Algoriphagus sp.]|uniref:YbbR-like domain-containing protein n=1 Tax=Algoriphagus sp. TaxID=1872435 RepID=UPI00391C17AB
MPETKKSSGRISSRKLSNLKVVVLCIAAATTFWILNALNKDNYTTVVDYPLAWDFDQERFMAVQPLPESFPIEISGDGWDLLRKYFRLNEPPFIINLAEPSSRGFILTSDLKRPLGDFISPTTLVGALKDSIHFQIDRIETRSLDLVLDSASFSLAKNVEIDGPINFSPKKVTVTGPSSLLDGYSGKFPVKLNENRISENFQKTVSVEIEKKLTEFVSLQEETIEVNFSIIQYLEGNKRLKIRKVNFPKSVTLVNEELTPMMSYLVNEGKVTELKDVEFEAVLDYGKRNREDSTLMIEVSPRPNYIKNIVVNPALVKLKYD